MNGDDQGVFVAFVLFAVQTFAGRSGTCEAHPRAYVDFDFLQGEPGGVFILGTEAALCRGYLSGPLGRARYVVAAAIDSCTMYSGAVHAALHYLAIIISMWKMTFVRE